MRVARLIVVLLALLPGLAFAQAGGKPVTVPLSREFVVDAPSTWTQMTGLSPDVAFKARTDAGVIAALQRVGQRPTDLPYAIVEQFSPDAGLLKPAVNTNQELIDRVVEYYRTAVNPPSKADRSPSWRKSKVSAVRYDAAGTQFRFDVTLTYDTIGDVHVVVSGLFDRQRVLIFSGWSDDAFDAAHPGELSAIRDSLRLVGPAGATVISPFASVRRLVQVVVGLAIVAVIAVQLVVLRRDRRARRGEAVEPF